jgi:ABC-2 type transport system ATP-binding protein
MWQNENNQTGKTVAGGESLTDFNKGVYVKNLCKAFGKQLVLDNISLHIPPGKSLGIVGNNGSGKTVLMKCICGFLKPDSGEIFVDGKRIGVDVDFPESLGMIIETPGFIPYMTGYKNLKLLAGINGRITKSDILCTLERVGLDPNLKKPVSKYSLGMRQRLGIAQAIMESPNVLILDEPFNGLDRKGVEQMRQLIGKLKSEGRAVLMASHNPADIEMLCDDVMDMMLLK